MKVLLIGSAGRYGAQLSLLYLSEELVKKNVDVMVVLPETGMVKSYQDFGISCSVIRNGLCWYKQMPFLKKHIIFVLKKIINFLAEYKLDRLIRREKIDIVHINSIGISVGAKSALKNNIKLVWHIREFVEEDLNRELYNTQKTYALVNKADKVIAVSQAVLSKYQNYINKEKMVVIPNGIDEKVYGIGKHKILSDQFVKIIYVGRIVKEKGQYLLLEALQLLFQFHKMLKVEFVGDGDNRELNRLRRIVSVNGWDNFVKFSGYCHNIPEKFLEADICIMATQMEAFGRVTVEAMMSGVLVIGSNTGGTMELLAENRGLIFNQGDAEDLADKIKYALNHKKEMIILADQARKYAMENYTSKINAERIINIYNTIMPK